MRKTDGFAKTRLAHLYTIVAVVRATKPLTLQYVVQIVMRTLAMACQLTI